MTDFQIATTAVREMSESLRGLAEDNAKATAYVRSHIPGDQDAGGEILRHVTDLLTELNSTLATNYEQLGTISDGTATTLESVSSEFRARDTQHAGDLNKLGDRIDQGQG